MKEIRLIALDLDNTTLDGEGRLTLRTRRAIERALSSGIEVVVASGRSRLSLPEEVVSVAGLRYAITSNGAAVYDLQTGEALHRLVLSSAAVEALLEQVDPALELQVFIDGQGFASAQYLRDPSQYAPTTAIRWDYLKRTRRPVEDIRRFVWENRGRVDMFDVVLPDPDRRETLIRQLRDRILDIYVTTSAQYLVEVVHPDCGKRAGLRWLGERLGISAGQTAAFGDAENDRDMIEYAGLGCAVANAEPQVRAAADWVVPSHREDGVAWAIETILAKQGVP